MATVVLAGAACRGIEQFVAAAGPERQAPRIAALRSALALLASHPLAGSVVERGLRQLVISHGSSGALALYRFAVADDEVRVLARAGPRDLDYRP